MGEMLSRRQVVKRSNVLAGALTTIGVGAAAGNVAAANGAAAPRLAEMTARSGHVATPTATPVMESRMQLFADPLHQEFATWALGFAPAGGADIGEIIAIANAVNNGDDGAYYDGWAGFGDRLVAGAAADVAAGHRQSAREAYLHAACFYGIAFHPLYGTPVDPRLLTAFRGQMDAFDQAMALSDPLVERLEIPFEGHQMPAYFIPAAGHAGERRPLVIATNGYDATVVEMFFAFGKAAADRGYHCLLFDGPGQGKLLIEDGVPIRADWETVIRPVVDYALTRDDVDPDRIALEGWSLGGYLALRAASGEPRLAACIADPGISGMRDSLHGFGAELGLSPEAAAALPEADDASLQVMTDAVNGNPELHWNVVSRGFWVTGVSTMAGFLQAANTFSLDGRVPDITCSTLLTMTDQDPLSQGAPALLDQLTGPKDLIRFTAAEGAGEHCEILNRSLLNRRVFDWLDGVFGPADSASPAAAP